MVVRVAIWFILECPLPKEQFGALLSWTREEIPHVSDNSEALLREQSSRREDFWSCTSSGVFAPLPELAGTVQPF